MRGTSNTAEAILYGNHSRGIAKAQNEKAKRKNLADRITSDQEMFAELLDNYHALDLPLKQRFSLPYERFNIVTSSEELHCPKSSTDKRYRGHILVAQPRPQEPAIFVALATYGPGHKPESQNNVLAAGTDIEYIYRVLNKQLKTKQRKSSRSQYVSINNGAVQVEIAWNDLAGDARKMLAGLSS